MGLCFGNDVLKMKCVLFWGFFMGASSLLSSNSDIVSGIITKSVGSKPTLRIHTRSILTLKLPKFRP